MDKNVSVAICLNIGTMMTDNANFVHKNSTTIFNKNNAKIVLKTINII